MTKSNLLSYSRLIAFFSIYVLYFAQLLLR